MDSRILFIACLVNQFDIAIDRVVGQATELRRVFLHFTPLNRLFSSTHEAKPFWLFILFLIAILQNSSTLVYLLLLLRQELLLLSSVDLLFHSCLCSFLLINQIQHQCLLL